MKKFQINEKILFNYWNIGLVSKKSFFVSLLFVIALLSICMGIFEYAKLSKKEIDYPLGRFYFTVSQPISIKSLSLYIDHSQFKGEDELHITFEVDVRDNFDFMFISLPWRVDLFDVKDVMMEGLESYSIDSSGTITIRNEAGRDIYLKRFMFTVKPSFEERFFEKTFNFPVLTAFSKGMPYSKTIKFMDEMFEPKINYFEIIFTSSTLRNISVAYPAPDAIVDRDREREYRWCFEPDKEKYLSSIDVSFVDKDLKTEENTIAFMSGAFLSIGFSILANLFFFLIAGFKKGPDKSEPITILKAENRQLNKILPGYYPGSTHTIGKRKPPIQKSKNSINEKEK